MKMREIGQSMAISIRISKEEWEQIKSDGDVMIKDRSVGYMQIAPSNIHFVTTSPFFKDMKELDEANKEKSDDQLAIEALVIKEITEKVI